MTALERDIKFWEKRRSSQDIVERLVEGKRAVKMLGA
jgi:hypothetical protein